MIDEIKRQLEIMEEIIEEERQKIKEEIDKNIMEIIKSGYNLISKL